MKLYRLIHHALISRQLLRGHVKTMLTACALLAMTVFLIAAAADDTADRKRETIDSLYGTWSHFDIYYHFSGDDELRIEQMRDGRQTERKYQYSLIVTGTHTFLRCTCEETAETALILKSDVSDSTAVMALGTAFVRADSGDGLTGTWERSENLSIMRMVFTDKTVEFSESRLDLDTGAMVSVESRRGVFTLATGKRGQIHVTFESGETVDMVPLVAGNIVYLFDLSPRKSLFVRKPPPAEQELLVIDNHAAQAGSIQR